MILAATGHNFGPPLPELESRVLNLRVNFEDWTRNCEIKRLVEEDDGPLGSGVEAPVGTLSAVQVIFRACEVRELEYPSGPIFR